MAKKAKIMRYLNMRTVKAGFFSTICRLPKLRNYLHYYQDAEGFESLADPGSLRVFSISPSRDYGINFTAGERKDIMLYDKTTVDNMLVTFKMARVSDVSVLGSSGVSVSLRSGKALHMGTGSKRLHRNWVIARPLKPIPSNNARTYINLLWVNKGHRHFSHFFLDTLIPLMVYLKRWREPEEKVVLLVREDLSVIQQDAYRFIEEDFPGVVVQKLPADRKITCTNTIFLAYENLIRGRDNFLERDTLLGIRDMFLRRYGSTSAEQERKSRLYLLRGKVPLRHIRNEDEVLRMLARYGVEPRDTMSMSFPEQARLLSGAELVVAPHGSALTNLMFAGTDTKVLEIFPANYRDDTFLKIAKAMGQSYSYFLAGKGDPVRTNFNVDVAGLEEALLVLLAN